jgi:CelD/BcsL family acetyltransferase involved in cellulose biosynthesis
VGSASTVSIERLAEVECEWDELADRAGAAPFARPGWVSAWWRAFGRGRLEIHAARDAEGRLVAVLPLTRRLGALASTTNWHSHASGLLARDPAGAAQLVTGLLGARPRRLALGFLCPEDVERVRGAAERGGYRLLERTQQRSPCIALDGDWERYERALGSKRRSDLRRRRKLLDQQGAVTLDVVSGGLPDTLLAEGFSVEAAGWKGRDGTAIRAHAATLAFYTDVARWAAERGWLRLAFLRLDGRALAFDLALEHAGTHYLLKTGFDPEHREHAPGKLLRLGMLERAFRGGLRAYEFLGADVPWKREWTEATRPRVLVQAFRPSPLGALDWGGFALGRPLAKRVRDLARGLGA